MLYHVQMRVRAVARIERHAHQVGDAGAEEEVGGLLRVALQHSDAVAGLSPSPIRPLANLQPRSQVCAKVSRSLPWTTASRSAKNAAARRIAVVTSMASSGHLTASQTNPQGSQRYPLLGPDLHRQDRTSLRLAHLFDHLVGARH